MEDISLKLKAKALYLQGKPLSEIVETLGVNLYTLKSWTTKGSRSEPPWRLIKDRANDDRLKALLADKDASLDHIYSLGISAVVRGLQTIELSDSPLSPSDMKKIVDIMDKVDGWMRLEEKIKDVIPSEVLDVTQDDDGTLNTPKHPFLN